MAEERHFESLFVPEHTHIPVSRRTPYPPGGELPREYTRTLDPFVALTAAAAATERLRVGTGICLVAQRDPIVTAKAVASLDLVSGGRVLFGVGAGWNEEEMESHGVDPPTRWRRMREHVEAIKALWTQDEASYEGQFARFEPSWSWPKPVQQPHPPVLVAGNGRRVLERVLGFGDEWYPNRIGDDERIRGRIERLQKLGREAGRQGVPVTLQLAPLEAGEIEPYEAAGVTRVVWYLPSAGAEKVERALERYTAAMEAYGGSV
ncbi:MAG: LLM class F420-dependent oxidoreductase [Actinobacteria bacterium]|nr:MAG: LLM class F420-dependent oxidoreductase [Actinomycetota bacterium]